MEPVQLRRGKFIPYSRDLFIDFVIELTGIPKIGTSIGD
jgi:hypothetical protein